MEQKFAIVGTGLLHGRFPGRTSRLLQAEAARLAILDSGLKPQDIDGSISTTLETGSGSQPAWTDAFPRILGLPVKFHFTVARGGAIIPLSIMAAQQALQLGIAKYVVVAYGSNDWSRRHSSPQNIHSEQAHIEREGAWGTALGDLAAISHHSFFACRHMHEYGTTSEQFGAIAVAERAWACLNPDAEMYGRPITLADHQKSPVLVWPYHLLDACLVSDGGGAFVITTLERARDLPNPFVEVLGIGFGEAMADLWWEHQNYTQLAVKTAKAAAFGQAGISLKDIDVAEFYDCFTAEVLFQLEDYGWCDKGEGGAFVEEGHIAPGGDTPINTGGGLMSDFYMADWTGFMEAMVQLRDGGGLRQVSNAKIAMVTGHGGEILRPGLCSIHSTLILGRES